MSRGGVLRSTPPGRPSAANVANALAAVALALVAAGGAFSFMFGQPAYSTGDEPLHADYAYQLWHGHLPNFYAGMQLQNPVGGHPSVQWVSHHPPLFYLLLAPVIGPLADAGHPILAVMWARLVTVILGVATVFAVRWMVVAILPGRRWIAYLAALLFALSSWYPRQAGSVYNDILAALLIVLAVGFLARTMREPNRHAWLIGFWITAAAGGLTRFSLLPQLTILVAFWFWHRWRIEHIDFWRSLIRPCATVLVVLATSGWWWLRNYRLTGNLQGEHFVWFRTVGGLKEVPVGKVVSNPQTWQIMFDQFFSTRFLPDPDALDDWRWRAELWLLFIPLGIGLVALLLHLWQVRRVGREVGTTAVLTALMVVLVAASVAMQVTHLALGNHNLARYFLPVMPFATTVIAFALARLRIGPALLVLWMTARMAAFSTEVQSAMIRWRPGTQAPIHPPWSWDGYWVAVVGAIGLTFILAYGLPQERRALKALEQRRPQDRLQQTTVSETAEAVGAISA